MKIIAPDRIRSILPSLDLIPAIEAGFVAYSAGRAVVPPVGELILDGGEVHIKYGFIKGEEYYVIKIASGFFDNPALGLPSGNGMMLMFSQRTGEPVCLLQDEGHLTDVRTAVAGAIAAKYLAPRRVERIGIVGTGVQAKLQLEYLKTVTDCRKVLVHGRGEAQLEKYRKEMQKQGFAIEATRDSREILKTCNLVVTTTPAKDPLLHAGDLKPGTHITAVGSDTPEKQELDAAILARAEVVVADSIPQCLLRGEIHQAIGSDRIAETDLIELGNVIAGKTAGRSADDQITVADLTGVAVQDIQISKAVFEAAEKSART
jgi:ornithine cyclodeaminase